jgi:hypothetical protein
VITKKKKKEREKLQMKFALYFYWPVLPPVHALCSTAKANPEFSVTKF